MPIHHQSGLSFRSTPLQPKPVILDPRTIRRDQFKPPLDDWAKELDIVINSAKEGIATNRQDLEQAVDPELRAKLEVVIGYYTRLAKQARQRKKELQDIRNKWRNRMVNDPRSYGVQGKEKAVAN